MGTAILIVVGSGANPYYASVATAAENNEESVELEAITVTANKREQEVQKIPISITTFSDTMIDDMNIRRSEELFNALPNIYITKAGPPADLASQVAIRGVSQFMGGAPSFGFYVDDVYYNEYDPNLFDIERIELLRGPQGTLYGRNTIGGVLNIVTKKPDNFFNGRVSAGYGNLNTYTFEGVLSGPIVEDRLFFRTAGRFEQSDGYMKNIFSGDDSVNEPEEYDGRLSFHYNPTDKLSFDLGLNGLRYESRYVDYVLLSELDDSPHRANVDYEGDSLKTAYGINLRTEYQGSAFKTVAISSLRDDENELDHDIDFTPLDGQRQLYQRDYLTLSQEIRFISDTPAKPLSWLLGLYGFYEEQDENYVFTLGEDFANPGMGFFAGDFPVTAESKAGGAAIFGEGTYTFANSIALTFGLRYDWEDKEIEFDNFGSGAMGENDEDFDAVLPKFAAMYLGNDRYMPYFTVSRGYKSGGFNVVNSTGEKFDPEFTWNYELGLKTSWLKQRVQVNAAVYYIDWEDLQVTTSNGLDFLTDNAGSASSQGFELEFMAKPTQGLNIYGGIGYTDTEFDDYFVPEISGMFGPPSPAADFSGNSVPYVPEWTVNAGVTYRFLNGFFTNVDYSFTDEVFIENDNEITLDEYHLVNAKIGYETEKYDIYLYARNLFDEAYATSGVDFRAQGGGVWARAGAPLTYGITLQYRF